MSLDEIKALPVGALAAENCALLLWGIWPEHPGVIDVITAWGFEYKTAAFVWVKTTKSAESITLDGEGLHWGMGFATRSNTEPCLLGTRGRPLRLAADVHQVIIAPVGDHSTKPDEAYRRMERLFPGPRLNCSRAYRGWAGCAGQRTAAAAPRRSSADRRDERDTAGRPAARCRRRSRYSRISAPRTVCGRARMNRHEPRARRARDRGRYDRFFRDHVRHLPGIPL